MIDRVNQSRNVRLQAEAQKAVEMAEIAGVKVRFQDSLDAGNCNAGTMAWAGRHNIDISREYDATDLLKIAGNDDLGRVRLVIRQAIMRAKKEADEKAKQAAVDAASAVAVVA